MCLFYRGIPILVSRVFRGSNGMFLIFHVCFSFWEHKDKLFDNYINVYLKITLFLRFPIIFLCFSLYFHTDCYSFYNPVGHLLLRAPNR